jgi:hypothetical protein
MTTAHLIYIPMAILVGMIFGFFLGGRAARDAFAHEQKKVEKRAAARAARQAAAGKVSQATEATSRDESPPASS